jgi:hypothetical protein
MNLLPGSIHNVNTTYAIISFVNVWLYIGCYESDKLVTRKTGMKENERK